MKPITRNLFTYQADILATAAELDSRLPHFTDPGQHERSSFGFIPVVPDSESRVLQFTGGWALCYREDKKLLPSATVRKAVDEKAQAITVATGRRPGKKRTQRDQSRCDLRIAGPGLCQLEIDIRHLLNTHQSIIRQHQRPKNFGCRGERFGPRARISEDFDCSRERTCHGFDAALAQLARRQRRRRVFRQLLPVRRNRSWEPRSKVVCQGRTLA
ncbi:hypothetical protein F3K36_08620 [Delftia sp. BR1]|nr:hypothetical protein F3K36_08620 [Delftia sp. BR1]